LGNLEDRKLKRGRTNFFKMSGGNSGNISGSGFISKGSDTGGGGGTIGKSPFLTELNL
jgi:hypothetical protein